MVLTGSAGKLGSVVVHELRAAGHTVAALDRVGPREPEFVEVDLADYGQVVDALRGEGDVGSARERVDAVVHLAAIPAPGLRSDAATFHNTMDATINDFWACVRPGITRIVFASSETVLGLPSDEPPPWRTV